MYNKRIHVGDIVRFNIQSDMGLKKKYGIIVHYRSFSENIVVQTLDKSKYIRAGRNVILVADNANCILKC